jgi:hypothetical protein
MSKVSRLYINDNTKKEAENFLESPSHALMIVGSRGNGSGELAEAIALGLTGESKITEQSSQQMTIRPNKHGNISIEDVRSAWSFAKVPTGDDFKSRKCVIIYSANAMTTEAQNSLLKLLEEPPEYMHFILTVPSKRSILPTIDSRAQKIELRPLPREGFLKAVSSSADAKLAEQLYLATGGEVYKALNIKKGDSPALSRAKEVLSLTPFERLSVAGKALSDREEAIILTNDLFHISFIGLSQSIKAGKSGKNWLKIAKSTEKTIENLEANGSVKLNMTYLLTTI